MICRFFIILFLIVAKGIYAPLLAGEPHTQQKSQETKEFSAAPELSYRLPDLNPKDMYRPIPPELQKKTSSSPVPESKEGPSKEPAIDGCNSEVLKNSKNIYIDSVKELDWFTNYIGFGILIAIFIMNRRFKLRHKCLVLFSSFFAILSLSFNYYGCVYLLIKSQNILRDANQNGLDSKYTEMWVMSGCIYWTMQVILVVAVILFLILSYHYFFKAKEKRRR